MLSEERRKQILERVGRLLQQIDTEVHLHEVMLDSTRKQLAIFMQKGEWPVVVGMNYLDYVSLRDDDLMAHLQDGLRKRLEGAMQRQAREESE